LLDIKGLNVIYINNEEIYFWKEKRKKKRKEEIKTRENQKEGKKERRKEKKKESHRCDPILFITKATKAQRS
jgi:hypothetical protein